MAMPLMQPACAGAPGAKLGGCNPLRGNLYVSLSGQIALQQRLDTIASNIANVNTPGYRADGVTFSEILSKASDRPTSFVGSGTTYITRAHGTPDKTDNPLDVAIQGDGWIAVKTPDGTAYTRDGRMQITAAGDLQTLTGYAVLDAGGTGMLLDPNGGTPTISNDGMVTQQGRQVGAIGLYSIPDDAKLSRYDTSAVFSDQPATAILDFAQNGVMQGFSESSNINPVLEMAKLVQLQRAFDGIVNSSQSTESSLQDAIKSLGSPSS